MASHRQTRRPLGMRMNDGADIFAGPIEPRVQMKFERRLRLALDQIALHVDSDDILDSQTRTLAIALIDQNAIWRNSNAAMAIEVDDFGILQHSYAIDKLLALFEVRN